MSRKISMIKGVPALRRGLCFVLSLCLVFGAFVFAPGGIEVEAEAETNLKYGESYTLSITVDVTDDADGWNSAKCKVYTRPTNGLGRQHLYKEYDIKGSVDEGSDSWNLNENLGNEFVSEVEIYTDFGGGFTWREWGADVTIKVNGINIKSGHITAKSSCFSSSDTHNYLPTDSTQYPWPKTINVINHHSNISYLPDEENFYEFYQTNKNNPAQGKIFINACDNFGVTWYGGTYTGSADGVTNDSGDSSYHWDAFTFEGVSRGSIYYLTSNQDFDHECNYTFSFNSNNSSHSTVTKKVKVNFHNLHELTVKAKDKVLYTVTGYKGQFIDLENVEIPEGYTLQGYDQTGLGSLDYIDDDDSYQFTFGEGDTTLTAITKANKYKVHFDGNGNTSGTMSDRTYTYDSPSQLPACTFKRTGYVFTGWNTEPDGSGTAISNRGFAINLTSVSNEVVTLYAQWAEETWDVVLVYPDEMALPQETVNVVKGGSYEPREVIDIQNSEYHWVYDGVADDSIDLSDINSDLTVELLYHPEEHIYDDPEVISSPSCGVPGSSKFVCVECGYEEPFEVDALTHDYFGPSWVWADDCSTAHIEFTCLNCGDVQTAEASINTTDSESVRTNTATAQFNGVTYTDEQTQQIYTINFDLNGGYGSVRSITKYEGEIFTLPSLDVSSYMMMATFLGWQIGDRIYQPGEEIEAGNYTAVAQWRIGWSNIQNAINSGQSMIKLEADLIADENDGPLTIPSNRTVTINLNGHKIDRNLRESADNGSVFYVNGGNLVIEDRAGGGMVTGGNTTGNGGAVYIASGSLAVYSGEISFNKAAGNGGAVYTQNGRVSISNATVSNNICGGTGGAVYIAGTNSLLSLTGSPVITGNAAKGGNTSIGGVYADSGDFRISDSVKITGNFRQDSEDDNNRINSNLGVNTRNTVVTIWNNLKTDALIGVSGEPGTVYVQPDPNDDSIHADIANFRSDNYDYVPALNNQGKLILVGHTHSFGEPEWIWAEDFSSAQAKFACTGCYYEEIVNAAVTVSEDATNNNTVYTATAEYEGGTYTDTQTVHTHDYAAFEWNWAQDYSAAAVTLVCLYCDDTQQVDAVVESIEEAETNSIIHTATAEYEGKTYTDLKTEHFHDYADPDWVWEEDFSGAKAVFTCAFCGETLEIEAEITSAEEPGRIIYTATAVSDGETYTDVRERHVHIFSGEPEWIWSDDVSSAQAVFTCTACSETETVDATVAKTGEDSTHFIYTASVSFEGADYTDTARRAKIWDIYIGGVRVTGDNCDDVFEDGTVKYDVTANTITLTDAIIEAAPVSGDFAGEYGILYNSDSGAPLKVVLAGKNMIINADRAINTRKVNGFAAESASGDCNPEFSGSGSLEIILDSASLTECVGLKSSGSVTSVNAAALTVDIKGSGLTVGIRCSNDFVLKNGAMVNVSTGGGVALYAGKLDMDEVSALLLKSGGIALSPACVITDATVNVGIRVNEALTADNAAPWDRSTSFSNYKYVSIKHEDLPLNAFLSADKVLRGDKLTWTVTTPTNVIWLGFNGTDGLGNTFTQYYKYSNYNKGTTEVTVSDADGVRTWTIPMVFNYAGAAESVNQTWTVDYRVSGSSEWNTLAKNIYGDPARFDILVYSEPEVIIEPPQGMEKYTLISATADKNSYETGEYGIITVVVTEDVSKVRIGFKNAATFKTKTATYQTTSSNVERIVTENGVSTWTIRYKFTAQAENDSFEVQCRGSNWGEAKIITASVS